ncbi:multidrug effflux MFS transporter [Streptomyces wuyuanensis]
MSIRRSSRSDGSTIGTAEADAATVDGRLQRRSCGITILVILAGLNALAPVSMDMYLPAMPSVASSLASPGILVQLTLTVCLIGMALGQLVAGPMSDRCGRRRPLLLGMALYTVATAACALATDIRLLLACRLLQGLAGAAGIVIARAVVRDLYEDDEMIRVFSTLLLISGVAPVIGPVAGAQILRVTDWRGIFGFLAVLGFLLILAVLRLLPETLPADRRHSGGIGDSLRTMGRLLGDRAFAGHLLVGGMAFTAFFTYLSASPFVIQTLYGASPQTFGLVFGLNSLGLISAGQLNARLLSRRFNPGTVIAAGLALLVLSASTLVLTATMTPHTGLSTFTAATFILMSAVGILLPVTNSQALARTPHAAGSASALLGASSFLIGAAVSPLAAIAGERTALPMAAVQAGCTLTATVGFVTLCRPRSPSTVRRFRSSKRAVPTRSRW